MAYRFKHHSASIQNDVRTIAVEVIDDAFACVSGKRKDVNEVIHTARKSCKKLRGLIRLIRPVFDEYRCENTAFRDAGRGLSSLRDCGVLIETYDQLLDAFSDQVDRPNFAPIRRGLTAMQKKQTEGDNIADILDTFRRSMSAARKRASRWVIASDGFDALAPGVKMSYKAARRVMATAATDPNAEIVHEWRKRVKEHWYHARLLCPIWQKPMRAHGEVAEKLGDILGQHHDLEVFRKQLREHELGKASAQDLLIGLARQRQKALEKEAFSIGAKLLAEPAKNLTRRWRSYWNSWRGNGSDEEALAA